MSELELMSQHLRQPEYVHVLLNPLPLYGLALAAMAIPKRWPGCARPMAVATLVAAVSCVALGGWVAHAGGQVRHSEFRKGPPAIPAQPKAHSGEGHHHEH